MAIVALVSDLVFDSKVRAAAAAAGVTAKVVRTPADVLAALPTAEGVILDLGAGGAGDPVALVGTIRAQCPQLPLVAFLSHVEVELAAAARAAGATEVLPRSAFVQRLPCLLRDWSRADSNDRV